MKKIAESQLVSGRVKIQIQIYPFQNIFLFYDTMVVLWRKMTKVLTLQAKN